MPELVPIALRLLEAKLLVRSWGNLSARLDNEHFKITPSGRSYRKLKESDMVMVDLAGNYRGSILPSSEKGLHAAIYRAFPEARVIIHTHQNFASAFSLSGHDLEIDNSVAGREAAGLVAANGSQLVPVSSYEPAGTNELDQAALSALKRAASRSVLLAGHGAVFWGETAEACVDLALRLEDYCRATYLAQGLPLPKEPLLLEAYQRGLAAYLEDFAQMFGPQLGPEQEPNNGVLAVDKGLVFAGIDQEDAMNRHDVFLKNFLAAQVAKRALIAPLAQERAQDLRQNYLDSYSKRY
ncbi:MAG: class II aldolase/adducin family protein [Eubacteriales bacterium]|nr:class II aldolase/adducin family protein [Eubacteriales bacterium]